MKLHYTPAACSLAVHIALREAGLDFDLSRVDLARHVLEDRSPLSGLNPKNYVPVLVIDAGDVLTEVAAILQWVAEQAPAKGLLPPAGSLELQRAREWLNFIATELHKGFSPWLWHKETEAATREQVIQKLHVRLALVERHLEGRATVLDRFGVVDAYLFAILNWTGLLRFDITAYPAIRAYLDRIAARPAVRAALDAEGLLKAEAA
jgi:glutathione S-transferase